MNKRLSSAITRTVSPDDQTLGHAVENDPSDEIMLCRVCRLAQRSPTLEKGKESRCRRCGSRLHRYDPSSLLLARALCVAALIFYLPANLLPIVEVEYRGQQIDVTIFQGIKDLFENGHASVGILVLATSFLSPIFKILGMLFLTIAPCGEWMLRGRRRLYDLIRILNPWNSMEIFLLAVLLTLVSFGALASLSAGPGAAAFLAVVVLTTSGSAVLQPAALWFGLGTTMVESNPFLSRRFPRDGHGPATVSPSVVSN